MQTAIAARASGSRLLPRYKTENEMHSELAPNRVRIGSCVAADEYQYLTGKVQVPLQVHSKPWFINPGKIRGNQILYLVMSTHRYAQCCTTDWTGGIAS